MRAALLHLTAAAVLTATASLGAQTTPAAKPDQTAKPDQKLTTIVGCLVDDASKEFYVRTPAIQMQTGQSVAVGGGGNASGTTPSGRATTTAGAPTGTALYRITGLDAAQLRPHLNHRVEFQGHLTNNMGGSAGTQTKANTTVDASGKPRTTVETRMVVDGVLHATSMKMVSADCK